jgi:hypothetical protein
VWLAQAQETEIYRLAMLGGGFEREKLRHKPSMQTPQPEEGGLLPESPPSLWVIETSRQSKIQTTGGKSCNAHAWSAIRIGWYSFQNPT